MKDLILTGLMITVLAIVAIALGLGLHNLGKTLTWNMMYKDHAISLVCEMVKPEYLVNPEQCK